MHRHAARTVVRRPRKLPVAPLLSIRGHQTAVERPVELREAIDWPSLKACGPASATASTSAVRLEDGACLSPEEAVQTVASTLKGIKTEHAVHADKSPRELVRSYTASRSNWGKKPVFPPAVIDLRDHARHGTDWLTVALLQAVILGGSALGLWTRRGKHGSALDDGLHTALAGSSDIQALNLLLVSYALDDLGPDEEAALSAVGSVARLLKTATSSRIATDTTTVRAILRFVRQLSAFADSKPVRQASTNLTLIAWQMYALRKVEPLESEFLSVLSGLDPAAVRGEQSATSIVHEMLDHIERASADASIRVDVIRAALRHRHLELVMTVLGQPALLGADQRLELAVAALASFADDVELRQCAPLVRHLAQILVDSASMSTGTMTPDSEKAILRGLRLLTSGFAINQPLEPLIESLALVVLNGPQPKTRKGFRRKIALIALDKLVASHHYKMALHVYMASAAEFGGEIDFYYSLLGATRAKTSDKALENLLARGIAVDERALYRRLCSHVKTRRVDFGLAEARSLVLKYGLEPVPKRVHDKMLQLAVLSGSEKRIAAESKRQLAQGVVADPATYAILTNRLNGPDRRAVVAVPSTRSGRPTRQRILRSASTTTTTDASLLSKCERLEKMRLARSVSGGGGGGRRRKLTLDEACATVDGRLRSRVSNVVHLRAMLDRWPRKAETIVKLARSALGVSLAGDHDASANDHDDDNDNGDVVVVTVKEGTQEEWDEWRAATYALLIRALDSISEHGLKRSLIAHRSREKRTIWASRVRQ